MYTCLQQQLSEAKECLQAASRLSEQLEKKDAQIERLNEEGKFIFESCIIFLALFASCS